MNEHPQTPEAQLQAVAEQNKKMRKKLLIAIAATVGVVALLIATLLITKACQKEEEAFSLPDSYFYPTYPGDIFEYADYMDKRPDVILYCEDGYLYSASERDFEKVTLQKYSVPPEVFSVIRKGEPSIVVSDGVTVTVLGEEVVIDKSSCLNGYVCFKGRAFSIKDNKIYFGTFSKSNVLDVDFITDNFLIINSRFGKLLKLINLNG